LDFFAGADEEEHRHRLREEADDHRAERAEDVRRDVARRGGEAEDAGGDDADDREERGDQEELGQGTGIIGTRSRGAAEKRRALDRLAAWARNLRIATRA